MRGCCKIDQCEARITWTAPPAPCRDPVTTPWPPVMLRLRNAAEEESAWTRTPVKLATAEVD